jgi:predicted Zn-dependent protease
MVRISVSVIVEHDGRIESASSGGGGRYDYRYFIDHNFAEVYAQEAIRQAFHQRLKNRGDWLKCRYQQWCIFHWRLVRRFCL